MYPYPDHFAEKLVPRHSGGERAGPSQHWQIRRDTEIEVGLQ